MSQHNRAAQFAPFAALAGYEASIKEAARITEKQISLDDNAKETLNIKLNFIKEYVNTRPYVTIIYFVPDNKKLGGEYVEYTGNVRTIDEYCQTLIMTDKTIIPIKAICNIESELLKNKLENCSI